MGAEPGGAKAAGRAVERPWGTREPLRISPTVASIDEAAPGVLRRAGAVGALSFLRRSPPRGTLHPAERAPGARHVVRRWLATGARGLPREAVAGGSRADPCRAGG